MVVIYYVYSNFTSITFVLLEFKLLRLYVFLSCIPANQTDIFWKAFSVITCIIQLDNCENWPAVRLLNRCRCINLRVPRFFFFFFFWASLSHWHQPSKEWPWYKDRYMYSVHYHIYKTGQQDIWYQGLWDTWHRDNDTFPIRGLL